MASHAPCDTSQQPRPRQSAEGMSDAMSDAVRWCANAGDMECALFLMSRMKQRGVRLSDACLDLFFCPSNAPHHPTSSPSPHYPPSYPSPFASPPPASTSPSPPSSATPPSTPPPAACPSLSPPSKWRRQQQRTRHVILLHPPTPHSLCHSHLTYAPAPRTSSHSHSATSQENEHCSPSPSITSSSSLPLCPSPSSSSSSPSSSLSSSLAHTDDPLHDYDTADSACSTSAWRHATCQGEQQGREGWSAVPGDLLLTILDRTDCRSLLRAAATCKGWAAAVFGLTSQLSLAWCDKAANSLASHLVPHFARLQVLNLRRCPSLRDATLATIASSSPMLTCLLLSGSPLITDTSLHALAAHCPSLQVLDLSACSAISAAGVASLAAHCAHLRELSLCGCRRAATDDALMALAQGCEWLEVLNLGWCEGVTDRGVTAVARGCGGLRVVDLCGCYRISDASVVALAAHCPSLQGLGLHCCRHLTSHAMLALADGAAATWHCHAGKLGPSQLISVGGAFDKSAGMRRNLPPRLNLPATPRMGDATTVLYSRPPRASQGLVSLNISGCLAIAPTALQAVCVAHPHLHTCPALRSLNTSGCMSLQAVHCRCHRATAG
ncbi:hypothetical protein CLOM_g5117 [Closterium sp. NIES-68]|nr:hypothetical protein CLOM_g5117 [Closterium sp. NIES-68]GJP79638.1 hypothetical protein CLOP_g9847 [Closterium sp. NIES-67]